MKILLPSAYYSNNITAQLHNIMRAHMCVCIYIHVMYVCVHTQRHLESIHVSYEVCTNLVYKV